MAQYIDPAQRRDLDNTGVANPFRTYSNIIYPRTMDEVLQWAEWLWHRHGVYTMAIKRSIRYFLNELELYGDDLSLDERKIYTQQLHRDHNILYTAGLVQQIMRHLQHYLRVYLKVRADQHIKRMRDYTLGRVLYRYHAEQRLAALDLIKDIGDVPLWYHLRGEPEVLYTG